MTAVAPTIPVLGELELLDWAVGDDPHGKGRIALPVSAADGSTCTVVYLEVDPGDHIPLHTHTAEEIILVLAGSGIATAGDHRSAVSIGSVISAPAFIRHGFDNTGSETLRLAGFFGASVLMNTFEGDVAPFGTPMFVTPPPG